MHTPARYHYVQQVMGDGVGGMSCGGWGTKREKGPLAVRFVTGDVEEGVWRWDEDVEGGGDPSWF